MVAGGHVMAVNLFVRHIRRVVISVLGGTVLLLGVIMVVGPGPGLVTVAAGLGILGIEFAWARRWLKKGQKVAGEQTARFAPAWVKRLLGWAKRIAGRRDEREAVEARGQGMSSDGGGGGEKADEGLEKEDGKS
jgi:hypothetical protein